MITILAPDVCVEAPCPIVPSKATAHIPLASRSTTDPPQSLTTIFRNIIGPETPVVTTPTSPPATDRAFRPTTFLARPSLHFSIVEQLDGMLCCRFGLRLERDVMAPSPAQVFTDLLNLMAWECLCEDAARRPVLLRP